MFELVIYLRKIDPMIELAWAKWIKEEEETYDEIFRQEWLREMPFSLLYSPMVNEAMRATKWAEFVRRN